MQALVAIFEQLVPISGGGTPRTSHIVRALARRGHQVHVAAAYGVPPEQARAELGCAGVLPLPHVSRLDRRKMLKYLLVYPWSILRVVLYVRRCRPHAVIAHNSVAAFAALMAKAFHRPMVTVLDLTDLLFEYLESYHSHLALPVVALGRALERYALRHSDRVITISNAMRTILVQRYGVADSAIEIVHDGVDCQVFCCEKSDTLRQETSPWASHVCVLHGVIDPQDAPELVVEAAPMVLARFPDTAFWCIGDGAAVPTLRERVGELELSHHFYFSGWVSQQEVRRFINASDLGLVVLPDVLSARGRVTLKEFEYWACGRAAVLPRLPALQELFADGEASLFYAPGSATDLADKICQLLSSDERRVAMGRRGRDMVTQRFDWRALTDRLVLLCESYVAVQHRGPTPQRERAGLGQDEADCRNREG